VAEHSIWFLPRSSLKEIIVVLPVIGSITVQLVHRSFVKILPAKKPFMTYGAAKFRTASMTVNIAQRHVAVCINGFLRSNDFGQKSIKPHTRMAVGSGRRLSQKQAMDDFGARYSNGR
jgi:hypothetical protein